MRTQVCGASARDRPLTHILPGVFIPQMCVEATTVCQALCCVTWTQDRQGTGILFQCALLHWEGPGHPGHV